MAGEHRHDTDEAALDDQRVARKGDHAFPLGPILIADTGVADDGVREMRSSLLGDQADLEPADRNPAVGAVQVRVLPALACSSRTSSLELSVQMRANAPSRCSTSDPAQALERVPERVAFGQSRPDIGPQGQQPHPLGQFRRALLNPPFQTLLEPPQLVVGLPQPAVGFL